MGPLGSAIVLHRCVCTELVMCMGLASIITTFWVPTRNHDTRIQSIKKVSGEGLDCISGASERNFQIPQLYHLPRGVRERSQHATSLVLGRPVRRLCTPASQPRVPAPFWSPIQTPNAKPELHVSISSRTYVSVGAS